MSFIGDTLMNIDNSFILKKYALCHRCFGRLHAKLLHTSNYERGKSLKIAKAIELESKLLFLLEKYNTIKSENKNSQKIDNDDNDNNNDKNYKTTEENEMKKEMDIEFIESKINDIKQQLSYIYSSGLTEIKPIDKSDANMDMNHEMDEMTCNNRCNNKDIINKKENTETKCPWCSGIFNVENLNSISEKAINLLNKYEYDTFLVGTILPKKIKKLEKELKNELNMPEYMESIKQEFNRVMGKIIIEKTGKSVDKTNPDIVIMINPYNKKIKLQINSVFIKGRYKKLVRGIPQTHWACRKCRGKGCEICNYTGKQYPTSVEEIIAEPFMKAFKGKDEAFHGAGREDIDVRMLGNGRPFVLQIKEPKIRKADLEKLKKEVNKSGKVEILDLEYGTKKDVIFFKNEPHRKTYMALVECEDKVSDEELSKLTKKLKNLTINQRTPIRVSHRRADLVRVRRVYNAEANIIDLNKFELIIYCDGGLYIKELISGDEGRTRPSVSEILNKKCICKSLDVLEVHDVDKK